MIETQCFIESNPIKINRITFHIMLCIKELHSTVRGKAKARGGGNVSPRRAAVLGEKDETKGKLVPPPRGGV